MKRLDTDIRIGNYIFPYCNEAEVESSWDELTDTATIVVPRKISFEGQDIGRGESLFSRGDQVRIRTGYDGNLRKIFRGYVRDIKARTPLEIECEDEMWALKQGDINASYEQINLTELLEEHVEAPFQATGVSLGQFRVKDATIAKVLDKLKDEYGLVSWFRGHTLYTGLAYWPELAEKSVFEFGRNIIEDDLDYKKEDEVRIKVKAISMMPDNTKIEIELGDEDGETRTLHFYNLDEDSLREHAEQEMAKLKYTGYRGSFTAFGEPFVRHGDIAEIRDNYLDREGQYYIKKVVYTTGMDGFRQEITIDRLAA